MATDILIVDDEADIRDLVAGILQDEGHGARLADRFRARLVLLTNVMTDQIDRFHDAQKVQAMLGRIAARAFDAVVLNGDDALLARLAPPAAVVPFGVTEAVLTAAPRGLGYAETAPTRVQDGTRVTAVVGREAELLVRAELCAGPAAKNGSLHRQTVATPSTPASRRRPSQR